jgi:hypothetical protein
VVENGTREGCWADGVGYGSVAVLGRTHSGGNGEEVGESKRSNVKRE